MDKQFTLWVRRKVEVNTDTQRRCYNGAHASSRLEWTAWEDLLDYSSQVAAEDTMQTFQKINPTREYKVLPIGIRP